MKLDNITQSVLLHDAARLSGMDGHVQSCGDTIAERAMRYLGAKKDTPRKTSYLYLDSADACFYYQDDMANVTLTARWREQSGDLEDEKIINAFRLIKLMLKNMNELYAVTLKAKLEVEG